LSDDAVSFLATEVSVGMTHVKPFG